MRVLGIETSCDETAAAVVEDGRRVLSNIVASQDALHVPYGGVVPEIACRAHLRALLPVIQEALREADTQIEEIDALAVSHHPGLIGSLLIGLTASKTLAWLYDRPLVAVNHLHAHAFAAALEHQGDVFPCVALVASGGHTVLFHSRGPREHDLLGATIDDAAGESFDKVASLLGLPYPGGPAIDRAARNGNPKAVRFPRTMLEKGSLDFSFSGLKTAVLYHVHGRDMTAPRRALSDRETADVAASFQEAVVDVLLAKLLLAAQKTNVRRITVGGGVAANSRLRERLLSAADERGIEVLLPRVRFCVDNAAMIAGQGCHLLEAGETAPLDLGARPTVRRSPRARISKGI